MLAVKCAHWTLLFILMFLFNSILLYFVDQKLPHPQHQIKTVTSNPPQETKTIPIVVTTNNQVSNSPESKTIQTPPASNFSETKPTEPTKPTNHQVSNTPETNNKIISILNRFNLLSETKNQDKFTLEPDFIPITIRAFNRARELNVAVEYLRKVEGIEKTMLIFSVDGGNQEVFDVIDKIDFCQVKQLIHPYASSLLNGSFPGFDPSIKDLDIYKHSRDQKTASVAGIKHHIWWLWNYVFDQMPETVNIPAAIFLEDDHVVTFDFYSSVKKVLAIKNSLPKKYFGMTFGTHKSSLLGKKEELGLAVLDNLGIVLSRDDWKLLKASKEGFCGQDDYNWDLTISHLQDSNQLPLSIRVLWSRVIHIGICGVHSKQNTCDFKHVITNFEEQNQKPLRENPSNWDNFVMSEKRVDHSKYSDFQGYGGYGLQDQRHCLALVKD